MSSQRSLEQHLDRYVNLKSCGRWNIIVRVTLRAAGGLFNGHREVAVQCARVVNLTSWIHKQTFGESGSFFSITLMPSDEYGSPFAQLLIGTNRMFGRPTASQIASASAVSFRKC
jgi:hypothetical protein